MGKHSPNNQFVDRDCKWVGSVPQLCKSTEKHDWKGGQTILKRNLTESLGME